MKLINGKKIHPKFPKGALKSNPLNLPKGRL
jgi:hypothetical protein